MPEPSPERSGSEARSTPPAAGVSAVVPRLLHGIAALFLVLAAVPGLRTLLDPGPRTPLILALCLLEIALFLAGALRLRRSQLLREPARRLRLAPALWLVLLCLPWAALSTQAPDAAHLGFALYFIALWVLPPRLGSVVTISLGVLTAAGQIAHFGFTIGAVLGPVAASVLAVGVVRGYRALAAESDERARLLERLARANRRLARASEQLAASEREAGRLAERARLGRELHDTIAQNLSSIRLLLHAAEAAADHEAGMRHLRLARETAGAGLVEIRAVIDDLTPSSLVGASLRTALERACERGERETGVPCSLTVEGRARRLPMRIEATLLRAGQEALANALRHGRPGSCRMTLSFEPGAVTLDVVDDGRGFDPEDADGGHGLAGMRERAAELGGSLVVLSQPQDGTIVSVRVPLQEGDAHAQEEPEAPGPAEPEPGAPAPEPEEHAQPEERSGTP
ncbi:MAG: sensor histidine kinase [Pseudoclavibacter sp.]|nr:sensor histidine kinase [Pseudoclavibacter sp.]